MQHARHLTGRVSALPRRTLQLVSEIPECVKIRSGTAMRQMCTLWRGMILLLYF